MARNQLFDIGAFEQSIAGRPALQFGSTPAPATINSTTAPTAVPADLVRTRFKPEDVRSFNAALMNLLAFGQQADTSSLRVRERATEEEALRRAESPLGGAGGQLSPGQQAQVRGAQVGAVETEGRLVRAKREDLERKIENLPNLLSSISQFAEAFEDEGDKIISQTFEEDAEGNVTWIGITKNQEVIQKSIGKVGKGFKDEAAGSDIGIPGVKFTSEEKKKISALDIDNFPPDLQNKIVNLLSPTQQQAFMKKYREATKNASVDPVMFFDDWYEKNAGKSSSTDGFDWSSVALPPPVQ